jgi:hypothetical protein
MTGSAVTVFEGELEETFIRMNLCFEEREE